MNSKLVPFCALFAVLFGLAMCNVEQADATIKLPVYGTDDTTDPCAIMPTSSEPIKLLVPLYVYPGSAWDEVIAAANEGVQIIAIINPNSGPSPSGPDSSYVAYMKKMQSAGIEMVGYVHTSWGARNISVVNDEVNTYASKYAGLSGIFFDEASGSPDEVPYYTNTYKHVLSKSEFKHVILNPGGVPIEQYVNISTNIVIFEGFASSLPSLTFDTWIKCAPSASAKPGYQYKFSSIVHDAAQTNMPSYISQLHSMGVGLVYVTDGTGGCCTYNTLATYFALEASTVEADNKNN